MFFRNRLYPRLLSENFILKCKKVTVSVLVQLIQKTCSYTLTEKRRLERYL